MNHGFLRCMWNLCRSTGIISLILRRRPKAVLDLYQGSTPLMVAVKMRATIDIIVLLVPESVPENLKVGCCLSDLEEICTSQDLPIQSHSQSSMFA